MRCFFVMAILILYYHAGGQAVRMPQLYPVYSTAAYRDTTMAFAFLANPAMLAHMHALQMGVSSERRFLLPQLGHHQLAACLPVSNGAFGTSAALFGNADMGERQFVLGYGRFLPKGVSIGVAFHYFNRKTTGYAGVNVLSWQAGARFACTPAFHVGLQVYRPAAGNNKPEGILPSYSIGAGYTFSPSVYAGFHIEKREGGAAGIEGAIYYIIGKGTEVCLGLSTATASYFLSALIPVRSLLVRVSAALHPSLGLTPGMGLHYLKEPR